MEDRVRELLQDAFRQVPAHDANQAIGRARREAAGSALDDEDAPAVRSYEMILTTFAAFAGDRLHFVRARELVARACRILGVTPEDLVQRHGTGERRTAVGSEAPLLLPGPKGDA